MSNRIIVFDISTQEKTNKGDSKMRLVENPYLMEKQRILRMIDGFNLSAEKKVSNRKQLETEFKCSVEDKIRQLEKQAKDFNNGIMKKEEDENIPVKEGHNMAEKEAKTEKKAKEPKPKEESKLEKVRLQAKEVYNSLKAKDLDDKAIKSIARKVVSAIKKGKVAELTA